MPTGYTAAVGDGKVRDFKTFALRCARAMGACVMQRDDDANDLPKMAEPSDYHAKALAEATDELVRLQQMTVEAAGVEADAEWAVQVQAATERRNERRDIEGRYRAMLRDVEAWTPPTSDHYGLKKFMADQLRESIDFDCAEYASSEKHLSGEEWLTAKRGKAARDIGYHTAEQAKEVERTNGRNAWIQSLYDSLGAAQ